MTLTIVESDAQAAGRLHDPDGDAQSRGRQRRARGVGPDVEESHRRCIGVTAMRFIGPRFLSSYYKKVYDDYAA